MEKGFRLNRTYVLKFAGDMEGAEVKLRSTSTAIAMQLRASNDAKELVALLADHLVEWNMLDRKGEVIGVRDADAIMAELEEVVIAAIIREWYRAATGVTAPLDDGSTNGEPFPVESIPMETS